MNRFTFRPVAVTVRSCTVVASSALFSIVSAQTTLPVPSSLPAPVPLIAASGTPLTPLIPLPARRPVASMQVPRSMPRVMVPPVSALPEPTQELELVVGEIRMLPVTGKVKRIAVGNGTHLSATTVDSSLLLIGEQPGVTTMMVWADRTVRSYRVRVVPADLIAMRRLVNGVITGQSGLTVSESDAKLYITGVTNSQVLARLRAALRDSPNVIVDVQTDVPRQVTRSVLFRLHFVEVKKSLLENIGIQWSKNMAGPTFATQGIAANTGIYGNPPQATGNLLDPTVSNFVTNNGAQSGIFFGLASAITSRINLGVTDGDARVLASPELTAKSGGKARLQVGGEVPIPMAGAFGATTVEFKPYGIILSIEPVIDGNDVITAKLSTELSQIDPAVTVAGIPGFLTRSTATEISVRPGEMIALSGLINNELSNAIDKVPGLGSVPILGRLFRSDAYRNNKTDLVVLLEPEIIIPGQGMAAQVRDRGKLNNEETKQMLSPAEATFLPGRTLPPREENAPPPH